MIDRHPNAGLTIFTWRRERDYEAGPQLTRLIVGRKVVAFG